MPAPLNTELIYPLHWFKSFGVELEYMIVDRASLDVKPLADKALSIVAGEPSNEADLGDIAWSNELVAHVLEMKTNGPAPSLNGLAKRFQESIRRAEDILAPFNAGLLPTAMHPWMDPQTETYIWPHGQNEVYLAYDRIFGCRGHGWSNLQSAHLNLPFATEEEFVRLHAAIRLVLPLIPVLAASSPIIEGKFTGLLDSRLEVYRTNQAKIPSITGMVVPEAVQSIAEYHDNILARIYRDIAPFDPEGILQGEWLNSRGAIARFSRGAIEIRVIDVQESPTVDIAIAAAIISAVKALAEERYTPLWRLHQISTERLSKLLWDAVKWGGGVLVNDVDILGAWGLNQSQVVTLNALWRRIIAENLPSDGSSPQEWLRILELILDRGCLSERIIRACGRSLTRARLREVYSALKECLVNNQVFDI
ncbi:MAG: glutamate-cysteine ligase family protein [Calditrichota bacterium]